MPGSLESGYVHRRSKGEPRAITRSRSRAAAYRYVHARVSIVRPVCWSLLTFWEFRNRNGSSRRAFDARFATGVPPPLPSHRLLRIDFSCYFAKIILRFSERIRTRESAHFSFFIIPYPKIYNTSRADERTKIRVKFYRKFYFNFI